MKVGIFGGSFNPIHIGHLSMAWEVAQIMRFEKVFFVVSSRPPHKNSMEMMDAKSRHSMVKLACEDNLIFEVSPVELERKGLSYTIDTMRYFKDRYGDDVHFITGEDSFADIGSWKSARSLIKTSNFVIATRPGYDANTMLNVIQRVIGMEKSRFEVETKSKGYGEPVKIIKVPGASSLIHLLKVTSLDISSSMIRKRIEKGMSIKYLVPQAIEGYFANNSGT